MERKGTAVVTAEEVRANISKAKTVTLEEEKALRMRYGAKVDTRTALSPAHGANAELGDELLLIEMQLLRAVKARALARSPAPKNPTKDKIVRSLKTKKR